MIIIELDVGVLFDLFLVRGDESSSSPYGEL